MAVLWKPGGRGKGPGFTSIKLRENHTVLVYLSPATGWHGDLPMLLGHRAKLVVLGLLFCLVIHIFKGDIGKSLPPPGACPLCRGTAAHPVIPACNPDVQSSRFIILTAGQVPFLAISITEMLLLMGK